MNITRLSIQRPVGIVMIVLFFVVLGIYSYSRIGVELLPTLNTPYITVTVKYDGASAESVEQEVIKPVEDALSSLSGVKQITSRATYGRARVILEMNEGIDTDTAAIDATKKVDAIRSKLPDEADSPVVIKRDLNAAPIFELAVISPYSLADTYSAAENTFQDILQQAGGVSDIELNGGRDKEVAVEVDRDKLAAYKLSLPTIATAIKNENRLIPSGSVYTDSTQSDVRLIAQYTSPEEIGMIQVKNTAGAMIPLSAVATVQEQDSRTKRFGRINGQDAVTVSIYKNSDANIVETADNIMKQVQKLRKNYPDYQFIVVSNDAEYVQTSLDNTMRTLLEGLITTGLVLFLFLRGWRSTAAVMIAIPTSLISTFFVMYLAGFTFNMMSLMGMTLCIGILVDDSIVVLENITRHLQLGEAPNDAAEHGRTEIGMAAVAITLCDMAVFVPIAFMQGMTGQYFRQFGLTIVFAGAFSLLVSFTLTPMLASKFFKNGWHPDTSKPIWQKMDRIEAWAVNCYDRCLTWSLNHQKKILAVALAVFLGVISLVPLDVVKAEYMPQTDESSFTVNIEAPVGSSPEETDKTVRKIEEKLNEFPEVKYYLSWAGGSNAYEGRIKVQLVPRQDRDRSVWDIANEVRKFAAGIHEAQVRVAETQSSVAGISGGSGARGGSGSLRLELRGPDGTALDEASEEVQELLRSIDGVSDVNTSSTLGMPELQLTVNRDRLKAYNASLNDVHTAFSSAISGISAGELVNDRNNNGHDTDIKVRFRNAEYFKASDISRVPLSAGGQLLYLGDVATVHNGRGPVMLQRIDKQRAIRIGANIRGQSMSTVVNEINEKMKDTGLSEKGITYRFRGQATRMNDTFAELLSALLLAMLLIYMLLAVLYESVITPFIRMFSLPLGLIGSILLLLLTNNTLNLYSMIGILVMDGIVAKNGTLLIDYTLTLMDRGKTALEAVREAGKVRLKPIFMTTITMIAGMLPTALSLTAGSETRSSMAWVIIGGLLTSTVFTLLIIPIIFLFFDRHPISSWFSGLRKKLVGAKA